MKTYEYSKNNQYLTIMGEDTCEVVDVKPLIDFSQLLEAISTGASKAKGRLANGVKWTYNHVTGAVRFSYMFSSRVVDTIIDGVRKSIEWIKAQLSKMFGGK